MQGIINDLINRMSPATMGITVNVIYNRWKNFHRYKWSELGDVTYLQAKADPKYQKGII